MNILVTNDDGVYAPGLAALAAQMRHLGDVFIAAPTTEQSGVGHSITYLTPLVSREILRDDRHWAWAVDGSPADCVKLAISQLCPVRPDLVVSGINNGLNAGINVLYSGTVAAAIEGAFFGVRSIAVSLEYDPHADFDAAAVVARNVIGGILRNDKHQGSLFNINIPTVATAEPAAVKVVPMGLEQYGSTYEKRQDPGGRDYYWATWTPPNDLRPDGTDVTELRAGHITVTPLHFDLSRRDLLKQMPKWELKA
ncbi:5'/3'-nucleotidase SurE [Candidatus Laterigemmans baculatus]|uniref:5'/3'-nucleotidase SurE n=1 Tax=Candidatus Laterigemmans baculatus TaxID=2770505 RepID=UPI0013DD524B|nr:5'/3'-nucleotidase SurE [Candidatus Laterigemmans baculatus]